MVLAAVLFVHRMSEAVAAQNNVSLIEDDADDFDREARGVYRGRADLPAGVEVFELRGPFFFGVANTLSDVLQRTGNEPRIFVLGLREVPLIDATGVSALRDFADHCRRRDIRLILAAPTPAVAATLKRMGFIDGDHALAANSMDAALKLAAKL